MGVRLQAVPEGEAVVAVARAEAEPDDDGEEGLDDPSVEVDSDEVDESGAVVITETIVSSDDDAALDDGVDE